MQTTVQVDLFTLIVAIAVIAIILAVLVVKLAGLQEDKEELESEIRALHNKEYRSKLYN